VKRVIALILGMFSASFAVSGYSVPYNFATRDTIRSASIMANYNAGVNWSTAFSDTLEKKFSRFSDFKDTLLDTVKAKRLRASVEVLAPNLTAAKTFTIVLQGVTGTVTGTATYHVVNGTVFLHVPELIGTSNAEYAQLSGLPAEIVPTTEQTASAMIVDANEDRPGIAYMVTSGIITIWTYNATNNMFGPYFCNSGCAKGVLAQIITYRLP
jgi:hypothetical protein